MVPELFPEDALGGESWQLGLDPVQDIIFPALVLQSDLGICFWSQ